MDALLSENGLIDAQDLYYMLSGSEKIKLLDATYGGNAFQAFLSGHIEGTQFFDIDAVADQNSAFPHMLPDSDYFESAVSSLGISNDDHVVVYDQSGAYMASSRAWWMFRAFGHNKVYVLEGGLGAWKARGFKIVDGPVDSPALASFKAKFNADLVLTKQDVLENIDSHGFTIIDARPPARFDGTMGEPRPRMRAGHIPGSKNLPFGMVLDSSNGTFKTDSEIEEIFSSLSLSPKDKIGTTCGSGVTACTLALALYKVRRQNAAVYDGSWAEWGDEDADTPVEISA